MGLFEDNANVPVPFGRIGDSSTDWSMVGSEPKVPVASSSEAPAEASPPESEARPKSWPPAPAAAPVEPAPPSARRSWPPPRTSSVPPRPSPASAPPRPGSTPPRSWPPTAHEDLPGGAGPSLAFRPARLSTAELPADLTCLFRCDGEVIGPLSIRDLSTVGFSASSPAGGALTPGSALESLELWVGDRAVWSGEAVVVHGSADRFGARFTSGLLDMQRLRLGATLEGRLALRREQRERLPEAWRAAVADVQLLLEDARAEVDDFERAEARDPLRRREEEAELFEAMRLRWGTQYGEAVARLYEASRQLDDHAMAFGRSYASSMLMPLLAACPLHKRAYEKPLGYAGDYRMMELCFAREPMGDTLFGRFLFAMSRRFGLVRTAVAREAVLRDAIRRAVARRGPGEEPLRILAVAAGPAMELRRWLQEVDQLERPVEVILVDQDRAAHESAHRQVTRILLERHHGMLPVTVRCLHFSVRQIVSPRTPEEHAVVSETLPGMDLVYSTGLYDYLPDAVAQRLTQRLHTLLRPGGRMLLGNMVEAPDSTWIMEYALDWPILYRTEPDMRRLAERLAPPPARVAVVRDATDGCLFLDVEP
jgi:extracellular factor (EF) 3-hydroxypalmitic acid methyl ester biosynthesis protein